MKKLYIYHEDFLNSEERGDYRQIGGTRSADMDSTIQLESEMFTQDQVQRRWKASGEATKCAAAERFTALLIRIGAASSVKINSSPLQSSHQLPIYFPTTTFVRVPVESSTG